MVDAFFFTVFEGLPRQGPGLDDYTARAFHTIPDLPENARILDIGCGSGKQTLALARLCPDATITACDIHQPFLDDVNDRAEKAGLDDRITTLRVSMDELSFPAESFDLIWAEGSAFVMGFREALSSWKRLLKPGAYLALSELVWFTHTPTQECREYFAHQYPAMVHEEDARRMIRDAGYSILATLRLPDAAWWDHYYIPLSRRLEILRAQYPDDQEVQALLASFEEEIEVFRIHSREYGYSFFVARNEGDLHRS
jgi:ubiquinone/menaquinone biosynthesis C-methylase UbiE